MNSVGKPINPFIGPKPFIIGEALYGRNWEIRMLLNLLRSKRLVLLHSPSGAGKTSLIQAGLWPRLQVTFRVRPPIRVNSIPNSSRTSTNRYVFSTLRSLDPSGSLDVSSRRLSDHHSVGDETKPELWIFDQFEEVLSLDPIDHNEKQLFFEQLAEALGDTEEPRWALFAMREDYLGAMEPYLKLLPTGLSARFRLELLDSDAARQAIQKPAGVSGLGFTDAAARKLVDDLRRVRVDRPDGPEQVLGPYIEPVQLQVVCRQLWDELPRMTTTIDEEHIDELGNVDRALSRYYETQVRKVVDETGMDESVLRGWFDQELITERGFRDQTSRGPGNGGKRTDRALQILTDAHIIRAERRRDVSWYELTHDRLLEPLQTSNRTWGQEHPESPKRAAEKGGRRGRSVKAVLNVQTLKRAERGARWISFLIGAWLRRHSVAFLMNGLVAVVFFLTWWPVWPPKGWDVTGLAVALLVGWALSLLPGWLYVRFLRERTASLWDEYVLFLHQLAWDRPRHLPKPPVNTAFFAEWSNDGGDVLADQTNIYKQKFDAYYGKSVATVGNRQGDSIKIEMLFPIFLVTGTFAICWAAVLWDPDSLLAPTSVWDVLKFAFLGAYWFGVQMLVRRYHQNDLRSSAYASVMLRVIMVLILVAALSLLLPADNLQIQAAVAFIIGAFPTLGIYALQRAAAALLRTSVPSISPLYPLNQLDGMTIWYETRLLEAGIEDMQSLATANLVDLFLHTRVPIGRLIDWVDQAYLYLHFDRLERGWLERRLEYRKDTESDKNNRSTIPQASVTRENRSGSRTRTTLRQLGIRTATDLVRAFPPEQVDPDFTLRSDTPTGILLTTLQSAGLDPSQVLTTVRLLNEDPTLTPVWNWKDRSAGLGFRVGAERTSSTSI